MGSLSNRPLVELRVEAEASGDWRSVVACEDTVLHCLHRIVQHAFKSVRGRAGDLRACQAEQHAFNPVRGRAESLRACGR